MATPKEDIEAVLQVAGTGESQRLDAAILLAECMLNELRSSVTDWEQTARTLQAIKRQRELEQGD